jgi:D-alanyl-D-alanine carboxypeptidase
MGFLHRPVPLWIVVVSLTVAGGTIVLVFALMREVIYNYHINLPSNPPANTAFQYGIWPALENADFYKQVLAGLIGQKTTFVYANLSTMRLQFYENGVVAADFPILSKGKPGSWWETPTGLYKVESKIPKDYSSIAHVWSPWALDFQGNFLIHGWPYYPDGTPVASTYSGGCIRLSTNDAKSLYDAVPVGTPVLVYSAGFESDQFQESVQGPHITAASYLAADLDSNFVFTEKNINEQLPIASLTKLMTALVAVEYVNIEKEIKITPAMIVHTSIPRLKVGETISLYDLLQPLLKESSNEAAVAISYFLGPKYFVSLMNDTARSIGMTETRFTDVSGSDWGNVSTAHDLFLFAKYLYENRSFILKMTTNNLDPNAYGPSVFTGLQNFNVFTSDPEFVGGKVGLNGAASGTILSIFNGPFPLTAASSSPVSGGAATGTTGRPYVVIILGSGDYAKDAQEVLTWIRSNFR